MESIAILCYMPNFTTVGTNWSFFLGISLSTMITILRSRVGIRVKCCGFNGMSHGRTSEISILKASLLFFLQDQGKNSIDVR